MGCGSSKSVDTVPVDNKRNNFPASNQETDKVDFEVNQNGTQAKETNVSDFTSQQNQRETRQHANYCESTESFATKITEVTEADGDCNELQPDTIQQENAGLADHELVQHHVSVAHIDEDKQTVAEAEVSYAEFPTHTNLREANVKFAQKRKNIPKKQDGTLQPFPSYRRKCDIFDKEKFAELDYYADQTPHDMMRRSTADVVQYLNKRCATEMDKARAYFRWLATRDINNLIEPDPERDDENAVLKILLEIKSSQGNQYTGLYADMCRLGGLEVHIIRGKARNNVKLAPQTEKDDCINDWIATVINNEWRLVDVHWAAMKGIGGGPGAWELIDDNGKGYREVDTAPQGVTYQLDEFYFLTDPENFIYNHRPLLDEWQLLARPVTMTEFQKMAFLKHGFFEQNLGIGTQVKYLLQAVDGEVEIELNIARTQRSRFMYHLWHSTKSGKLQSYEGFQLSQFVLLQQRNDQLLCTVVFPVSGDYKIDIFARTETDTDLEHGTYSLACTYIMQCTEAKEEWNALPRNSRNEWGFSHEMLDLGIIPITHPDARIETDDGNIEIRFSCSKGPVDTSFTLRGQTESEEDLERCVLYRQNEHREITVIVKLPQRGYYALDLFAKSWGIDGSCSHLSTYLIASTTAAYNKQPFPKISNQMSGQQLGNIKMQLQPTSHPTSLILWAEPNELKLEFETPVAVDIMRHMHHWLHDTQDECTVYTCMAQSDHGVDFHLRFVHTGIYTFEVYAKPRGLEGTFPHVFTYVIFVLQSNPEWVPFPKYFDKWGPGCKIEGFRDGHVKAGDEMPIKVKLPDAEKVAVVNADNEWNHLEKDSDDNWQGNVIVGKAGKINVYANYGEGDNYSGLLQCEVKSQEELEKEKQARIQKEKEIKESVNKKKKEEEDKKKILEQQFDETRTELEKAIAERDVIKLRNAIAKVERNNYTQRLEKLYQEAKELKKSLEKIARLRKMVLNMDQKLMAVIRSYTNPPPLVHSIMRATFLMLGNTLKETKSWRKCQALSNTIELNKRIRTFDIRTVDKETAQKSRNILDPLKLEVVQDTSAGAATFYIWTLGMTEEVLLHNRK